MQVALAISEHAWPVTLILFGWWALRTRVVRAAAWSWLLRRNGVPVRERRALIVAAAQRDLDPSDPPGRPLE